MGVPAFYRWLSSYCSAAIKEVTEDHFEPNDDGVIEYPIERRNPNGEFDNLYLDLNGVVHQCSHPPTDPPQSEDEIFERVCAYVDRIMNIVRPRKCLFIAVDGVAPRAKMNQQRSRRFRAIQEANESRDIKARLKEKIGEMDMEELLEKSVQQVVEMHGLDPVDKQDLTHAVASARRRQEAVSMQNPGGLASWDHNVITPGTPFMARLGKVLRSYVGHRMSTTPGWKGLKVVVSDAATPGEGEHKVMDFIRSQRAQPGYDPDTRHVLHGLDADLIFLGLMTHEPNFYILREMQVAGGAIDTRKMHLINIGVVHHFVHSFCTSPLSSISGDRTPTDDNRRLWGKGKNRQPEDGDADDVSGDIDRDVSEAEAAMAQKQRKRFSRNRVVGDFVFLAYLAGNDFLPALPMLRIHDGGLEVLVSIYIKVLHRHGYITDGTSIIFPHLQAMFQEIADIEPDWFSAREALPVSDTEEMQKLNTVGISLKAFRDMTSPLIETIRSNVSSLWKKLLSNQKQNKKNNNNNNDNDNNQQQQQQQEGMDSSKQKQNDIHPRHLNKDLEREIEFQLRKDVFDPEVLSLQNVPLEKKHYLTQRTRNRDRTWQETYYEQRMGWSDKERRLDMAKHYVEGMHWVLQYYTRGCPSWAWYYPFHYAPLPSDLSQLSPNPLDNNNNENNNENNNNNNNIDNNEYQVSLSFKSSKPFSPLEQLLAVLPPSSAHALPKPLRSLMLNPDSPIADFYPKDFRIDLDDFDIMWQAITLISFIDAERLTNAIQPLLKDLKEAASIRNTFRKPLLFVHKDSDIGKRLESSKSSKKLKTKDVDFFGKMGHKVIVPVEKLHCPAGQIKIGGAVSSSGFKCCYISFDTQKFKFGPLPGAKFPPCPENLNRSFLHPEPVPYIQMKMKQKLSDRLFRLNSNITKAVPREGNRGEWERSVFGQGRGRGGRGGRGRGRGRGRGGRGRGGRGRFEENNIPKSKRRGRGIKRKRSVDNNQQPAKKKRKKK